MQEKPITVQLYDILPHNYVLHRICSHNAWHYPRHRHDGVFEFYYLFEGHITHHFDNGDLIQNEGELLVVREEEYHSLSGRGFDFFNLIIPKPFWEEFQKALSISSLYSLNHEGLRFSHHFRQGRQGWILDELEGLFRYQKSEYGDLLLYRFLLSLAAEKTGPPDEVLLHDLPPWFKAVMAEAECRIVDGVSVKDLSDFSGKSPEHISRCFRKYLGITPSAWLNKMKMERAALILEHSNTAVLDIALSLGFDNLGYFYKLFRDQYSLPPAEYRKEKSLLY